MPIVYLEYAFGGKPYSSLAELPDYIKKKPKKTQRQWRAVFNSSYARHHDESRAFREANGVIKK